MRLSWLFCLVEESKSCIIDSNYCSEIHIVTSWPSRLRTIFRATKTHALNLAKFVSLYKTLLLIQKKANGGKERSWDTFIAGLIGGYVVFGERSAINEQVCLNFPYAPPPRYSLQLRRLCFTCVRVSSRHSSPVLPLLTTCPPPPRLP